MTEGQFRKSIQKNELHLNFWDALTHYMIVIFISSIPITFIIIRLKKFINHELNESVFEFVTSVAIPCAIAFFLYLWQKHKLQFICVRTEKSHEKIMQILLSAANENGWEIVQSNDCVFLAKVQDDFNTGIWGIQVTALLYKDHVYLNCICDPEKRSAFTSYGKNKKILATLTSKLTRLLTENNLKQR